jgi:23S rRNA pseudouridine2457 synthase
MHRYFIVYKPYKMLSQFEGPTLHRKLGDLDFVFPEGTNAVGRLDHESEGLLILTTDARMTQLLLHPEKKHRRSYIVQVEKEVSDETVKKLSAGIEILVRRRKEAYLTLPCEVRVISEPPGLPLRENMLMERIRSSWLEFVLTEGKNRQIRKMCKLVRHSCWRLIRTKIENLELGNMQPGEVREIGQEELFKQLLIEPAV